MIDLARKDNSIKGPDGWAVVPLIDAVTLQRGFDLPFQDRMPGSVPIYAANGCVGTHHIARVKGPGVVTGRSGTIGKVHFIEKDFWPLNTSLYVRDFHGNDPRFVALLLRNLGLERYLAGTGVPTLNRNIVHEVVVTIPPLSEQKRIVAKIESLNQFADRARDHLSRVPTILKRFRQAVLTAACTGRLTEDWRNEHSEVVSAAELLDGIRNERPQKNNIDARTTSEVDFEVPEGWMVCSLEQIKANKPHAIKAGPFGSALTKKCYTKVGYKIYGQEQVIRGDAEYGDYFIGEDKFQELKSCAVAAGDLLISLVGTIGKVLVIPDAFQKGIINPRLVKISLHHDIYPHYLAKYVASDLAMMMLRDKSHGGTMEILNLQMLKELPIPLPPTSEQYEIVSRVDYLFALADKMEGHIFAATLRTDKLTQSILAKAFRGELVQTEAELARREGRDYEPASVLLERIRAERAEAGGTTQVHKRKLRKASAHV